MKIVLFFIRKRKAARKIYLVLFKSCECTFKKCNETQGEFVTGTRGAERVKASAILFPKVIYDDGVEQFSPLRNVFLLPSKVSGRWKEAECLLLS